MHTSTHCFFSQAVYFRLTLDISFMHLSVCLTKHMFVLTMQKAEPNPHPSGPQHNTCMHTTSIYFCYHTHFTIHRLNRADYNAPLQCFIHAFLIYFSSSLVAGFGIRTFYSAPHISFVPLFPFPRPSTNPLLNTLG